MFQSEKLIHIAQEIADERPEFFEREGAGKTNEGLGQMVVSSTGRKNTMERAFQFQVID